ncbi:glutaredoxin family protein [Cutibacterium sp.]|uniref:glutaredoxin family protein n=1 Tax=Cutibacterium sp. TaxID=1912221 RepID=UPI0026DC5CD2|nr:glutaredoxin family protein [Cutibacterium sp.]MDO4412806.1 glutaredoxin family protein [Cutibacterium sp.]
MWRRHRHDTAAPCSGEPQPLDPLVEGRLVVVTRRGCHLCHEVIELVAQLRQNDRDLVPEPKVIDVDTDEGLRSRWGDHVPVTFVDGTLIAYWTLDAETLMSALRDGPTRPAVLP